jgi:Tetratricopeptide repeat.
MLRNRAIARTGICYYRTGKYAEALPYLLKTLELVSIQEDPVWQEARETMYQIIQFRY